MAKATLELGDFANSFKVSVMSHPGYQAPWSRRTDHFECVEELRPRGGGVTLVRLSLRSNNSGTSGSLSKSGPGGTVQIVSTVSIDAAPDGAQALWS
jgi:hypothetical protein